ncbi:MAG: NAD(P)-dependent dehydrogenase (short-subunit alcohol dehydrogenase family) [Cyclobacteriaceae bacterium]|jgi:NAD(P)-dependent dehydrogenase (short-subunit alcohol dehydrogenase family)
MNFFKRKVNVAIIAGASGIGKEIARAYLNEDANVFICDVSRELIASFSSEFSSVYVEQTDVSDYQQVKLFFENISTQVDHLDILINGAGIAGPTALLENVNPLAWDKTINVNINGMFYCCKEAIPLLKKSPAASIINLASNAAFFGFPFRSAYTTAKWATIGMTKTLAMELGKDNIRVNAICPGSVSGDRIDRVIEADAREQGKSIDEIKASYVKQVSLKTFVDPEDVANMCLYLSSNMGRFVSGQALGLDGHTEGLSTEI